MVRWWPLDDVGKPVFEHSGRDIFVNAEVLLPQGEDFRKAEVCGRHVGYEGQVIGKYNVNPLMNYILYDIDFGDGTIK